MAGRDIVTVWIPGIPKTKGSMVHIGNGQMEESVDNTGWRRQIAARVRAAMAPTFPSISEVAPDLLPYRPVEVPVIVNALFVMPLSKLSADLDKMCRLVGDAIQAGKDAHPKDAWLIANDSLIVRWNATKVAASDVGMPTGLILNVQYANMNLICAMAEKTLNANGVGIDHPTASAF